MAIFLEVQLFQGYTKETLLRDSYVDLELFLTSEIVPKTRAVYEQKIVSITLHCKISWKMAKEAAAPGYKGTFFLVFLGPKPSVQLYYNGRKLYT